MQELRAVLEDLFRAGGIRDPAKRMDSDSTGLRSLADTALTQVEANAALVAALEDTEASDYEKLDAALELALLGDEAAIPTLRRVFDEPFFALTNSEIEYGHAAVALALLADTASIDRIRGGSRVNTSGLHIEMALKQLGA